MDCAAVAREIVAIKRASARLKQGSSSCPVRLFSVDLEPYSRAPTSMVLNSSHVDLCAMIMSALARPGILSIMRVKMVGPGTPGLASCRFGITENNEWTQVYIRMKKLDLQAAYDFAKNKKCGLNANVRYTELWAAAGGEWPSGSVEEALNGTNDRGAHFLAGLFELGLEIVQDRPLRFSVKG
jgi:hypothetical protein